MYSLFDFMNSCNYDIDLMMSSNDMFERNIESEVEKRAQKKRKSISLITKKSTSLRSLIS